jgi:hypothetical protein
MPARWSPTDVTAFDDLFYIAGALHAKRSGGRRLGAISGAGFEAVSMADSIEQGSFAMEMGALAPATVGRIREILAAKRLDALVEVGNPIDINPGADDEAHLAIAEAFLQDANIDAVVVALDPTAPAVRALEQSKLRPGFDINDPASTVAMMPPIVARNDKPIIGVIDAGHLYDAMAARLMDQGVCIFRNCARATTALVQYVEARQRAATSAAQPRSPDERKPAARTHADASHRRRPRAHDQLHGRRVPGLCDAADAVRHRVRLPRPVARAHRSRQGLRRHPCRTRPCRRDVARHVGGDHGDAGDVEGAAVSFDFTVRDAVEEVARGKHNRYIVGIEKTAQRLKAKLAKAGG